MSSSSAQAPAAYANSGSGRAPAVDELRQRASSGSGCALAAGELRQRVRSGSGRELRQRLRQRGEFRWQSSSGSGHAPAAGASSGSVAPAPAAYKLRWRSLLSAKRCRAWVESSVCEVLLSAGPQGAIERGSARRYRAQVRQTLLSTGPPGAVERGSARRY